MKYPTPAPIFHCMKSVTKGRQMTDATAAQMGTPPRTRSARAKPSENAVAVRILLTVLAALVAWGSCIVIWGLPGLYLPALALVPVIWVALILITLGR
jgi:fatty acid desaturase